jgi:GNAT superfamily N-acetyltransferase
VSGTADLRAFVNLPYRLHQGTNWIPPLKLERYAYLHRRLNPFFRHGEAEYFLARRDGRVVGRITAHIDLELSAYHDNRWGLFGFIEFEDDQEIVDALLAAAEAWLRGRGRDRMLGPIDFTMNDECGVLLDGQELEPMIREPWHPTYYGQRLAQAGLQKAMDLFFWDLDISDREQNMSPRLPRIAARAKEKYDIKIRPMSFWRFRKELDEFARVYNAAWSGNWGFRPFNKHDLNDLAISYRLVYDPNWFMIAEDAQGETIAMAITIPDINQVYKKMKGRLLPFGWYYYLRRKQYMTRVRIGFLGVMPENEHTGVGAALYLEHFDTASRTRIVRGEAGWILETNHGMNRSLEVMGGRLAKTCRIYERLLDADALPSAPPESVKRYEPSP